MQHPYERDLEWDDEPTTPIERLFPARVLVAEDDDALRAMMASRLRGEGCEVIEACNGDQAFEMIAEIEDGAAQFDALDLVIVDVRMPGLSGLEVLDLLRAGRDATPVLVVTAYPEPELRAEVRRLGAHLLAKPFGLSRLTQAANAVLRGRPS
jgi:DNA-binding response OmpR family regulator